MSDTILGGDFTVFYAAENNQKRVKWTGTASGTRTLNQLYSALQDLFDSPSQMDDVTPMKADTPDIYRMQNQWFIDDDSVEHLKTGSLFSDKWKDGTTEHILVIGYSQSTEFNLVDVGRTILGGTTGDTGTILDFNTTRKLVWVRPDDPAAAGDEFDNGTEAYTIKNNAFDKALQFDDSLSSFVDETTDANSAAANDWAFFPAGAGVDDYVATGFSQKYSKLTINVGTIGVGTYTVTWEYWNGTTWASLSGISDGTGNFKNSGSNVVTYTVPTDWATTSLNASAQLYYIRAKRDAGTVTTDPLGTQGFISGVGAGSFSAHGRQGSASKAGESAWVGITTIGSIESNTHIDIFSQDPDSNANSSNTNEKKTVATKGTSDWWGDGHINLLLKVKEADSVFGQLPASSPATAVATILARQYSKTYSHFIATAMATAGGNTVVPLSTADDLDNTTGFRRFTGSSGSGTFVVDEVIQVSGTDKKGVVTKVAGTTTDPILDYYLIGDPQTDFVASDAVTGVTSGAACTAGSPSNVGPASDTTITVVFGNTTQDINNGNGARPYSIRINPAGLAIERVYERAKFITRRGSTTQLQREDGEEYIGNEAQIEYTGQSGGNWKEGQLVFDVTANGRGVIVSDTDDGTTGDVLVKDVRGTFTATNTLSDAPSASITLTAALQEDNSGGTFVDETADAISAATGDVDPFPLSEDVNDAFYIGASSVFAKATITIGTSGVGGVGLWEYWNGSSWTSLEGISGFTDNSSDLTAATGARTVLIPPPADWVARTVSTLGPYYYIRLRVTTVYTTNPILDQVTLGNNVTATIGSVRSITPVAASPFGTFAGGKFFGAPGVTLTTANLATGDEQAYQLIDNNGVTQIPPNVQSVSVTNLVAGDSVAVFRRTGANVDKTQFSLAAGNAQGNTTIVVSAAIPSSNPTSTKIRIVSPSGIEHRYRYSSFSSATFTLATASTGTSNGGNSSATRLHSTAATFQTDGVEVGDFVRNTTEGKVVRVTSVISETELDTEAVTNWSGDSFNINTLVETYPSGQGAFVPFIEKIATASSHSASFTYSADIDVKVVVRNAGVILPFDVDTSIVSTGLSTAAIRSEDSIFT